MALCNGPKHSGENRYVIPDGDRLIDVAFAINWGKHDIREAHEKGLVFCSFACLSEWAAEKALVHGSDPVTEGVPV